MTFLHNPFKEQPPLPTHCTPTSPFLADISSYFGTCVPTPLAALSTLLGTLSIISWLFAQMPQIFKNYHIKSTAGLSIFFLSEWLLGDLTNLLGALFTRQAVWQIIVASYYVFVDVCLVCQYFWYTHFTKWAYAESLHSTGSEGSNDGDGSMINGLSPINSNFVDESPLLQETEDEVQKPANPRNVDMPNFSQIRYGEKNKSPTQGASSANKFTSHWMHSPSPRTFLYAATLSSLTSKAIAAPVPFPSDHYQHGVHLLRVGTPLEIAGTVLAWCSTVLYLASRLPQLYKNWQRQSTAGLSPLLFGAAFCGNLFYSTSLIANPNAWNDYAPHGHHGWIDEDGSQRWAWVARAAPFFLGSAGCLSMDALMGVQFVMYGEQEARIIKVRDRYGSHWERVNGWMRGWIPSMAGKDKVVDLAESQRLLGESTHMSLSRRHSHHDYGTHG